MQNTRALTKAILKRCKHKNLLKKYLVHYSYTVLKNKKRKNFCWIYFKMTMIEVKNIKYNFFLKVGL